MGLAGLSRQDFLANNVLGGRGGSAVCSTLCYKSIQCVHTRATAAASELQLVGPQRNWPGYRFTTIMVCTITHDKYTIQCHSFAIS